MRPRITLSTFRKIAKAEDTLARAMMPRTSAADPIRFEAPLPRNTGRTARTLTYKLAEAA